ncbi:MAG: DUF2764 family protein [Dehalococcoidia bacterium]
MTGDIYYLLASLPALGDLGSPPPLTPAQFLERIAGAGGNRTLVEAIFLSDDLLQWQAFHSKEKDQMDFAVLTPAQTWDEEPFTNYLESLPQKNAPRSVIDTLIAPKEASPRPVMDIIWEAYFRYAASVARAQGSEFLASWVQYEVSLKNALAVARAKALNLDPREYEVARDLGGDESGFSSLINEWSVASNPLDGLRALDGSRWKWLNENDAWFTFGDDELAAYAAKLVLLQRWNRLSGKISSQAEVTQGV